MARYQHLPLYQGCYALSREVYRLKVKLPRCLKHDLGSMVFSSALRSVRLVIFANGAKRKQQAIQELLLEIELMWTLSRLLLDLNGISKGEFQVLSEKLSEISPQANAWLKWERESPRNSPRNS